MKKPLSKKAKIILIVLGLIALVGGCIAAVSVYARTSYTEGTVDLPEEIGEIKTPLDGTYESAVTYLAETAEASEDSDKTRVNLSENIWIDDSSVKMNCSDADAALIKYALGKIPGMVNEVYPSHEGSFGDKYVFDNSKALLIASAQCDDFEVTEGQTNDSGEVTDEEKRFFTFNVKCGSAGSDELFGTSFNDDAVKKAEESFGSYVTLESCSFVPASETVYAAVNKTDDHIDYIKLSAVYNVSAVLKFTGDYASLGTVNVSFSYNVESNYSFTYAGVSFTQSEMFMTVGEEETLPLTAVIDDSATSDDYTLVYTSSDESVATVDESGNVTAVSVSKKPAVITAKLTYLGNTYTSELKVYTTVAVTRIETSPSEASLKAGGKTQLTCKVEPDDATVTSVLWFTEDESIAVIDENGVVTATGKGETKVYAVSVDGHFKSSCTITVEGEAE